MPRPNIEEETKKFQEKLERGEFKVDRLGNSEENYSERKLARDTKAIKDLSKTKIFKKFVEMK